MSLLPTPKGEISRLKRGLTLVEVVVSMTIFSITAIGILGLIQDDEISHRFNQDLASLYALEVKWIAYVLYPLTNC